MILMRVHSQALPVAWEDSFSLRLLYPILSVLPPTTTLVFWLVALLLLCDLSKNSASITILLCLSSSGVIGLCLEKESTTHPLLWILSALHSPLALKSFSCYWLVLGGHYSCQNESLRSEAPESIQHITQTAVHGAAQIYHSLWAYSVTRIAFSSLHSSPTLATPFQNALVTLPLTCMCTGRMLCLEWGKTTWTMSYLQS